jgi:hypothetical protein
METHPIVPELDVPGNILLRFLPCRVDGTVDPLDLHCRIERLGESVIEAYPCPANRLPDAQTLKNGSELGRGVIAAPVRMEDSALPSRWPR